jgi:hypothetical protein
MCTASWELDIVAEMDGLLPIREATEPADRPNTDKIFNRMSLYMALRVF